LYRCIAEARATARHSTAGAATAQAQLTQGARRP